MKNTVLKGALTEADLPLAELEFPGITAFFGHCTRKPTTFLDLVFAFMSA